MGCPAAVRHRVGGRSIRRIRRASPVGFANLQEYWHVVDYLLLNDREIHAHVYGGQ